ncbi:hypothetical protein MTR67_043766 [Solanum verrucosum]|uniref:Uncharacterized protein n=1 Tax=Solanum verrucosum TaxID=315347 RepID=A0AAF0USL5_SOLVR|nr:hypothetical protein MTR67_043766 [Solanum verrucosum]
MLSTLRLWVVIIAGCKQPPKCFKVATIGHHYTKMLMVSLNNAYNGKSKEEYQESMSCLLTLSSRLNCSMCGESTSWDRL